MGIFDFFRSDAKSDSNEQKHQVLLQSIIDEAKKGGHYYHNYKGYPNLESFQQWRKLHNDVKEKFLHYAFLITLRSIKEPYSSSEKIWHYSVRLIPFLLKEITLDEEQIVFVAEKYKELRETKQDTYSAHGGEFISILEQEIKTRGLTTMLRKAVLITLESRDPHSPEESRQIQQAEFLLQENKDLEVNQFDEWGAIVVPYFIGLEEKQRKTWIALFLKCGQSSGKSSPTQKWLKEAKALLADVGEEIYSEKMIEWLPTLTDILQRVHKNHRQVGFLKDKNHEILKGLIWCVGLVNNSQLNTVLDDYAAWAYKKLPSVGPVSARTGTAAMFAFSILPVKEGISRLSKFRKKIKNNTILKSINRLVREVSEKNGTGMDEMEEMSTPDFGIVEGLLKKGFDDFTGVFDIRSGELKWEKGGKLQKSIPAEVKEKFPTEIKSFKSQIKEIESLLPVVSLRLEDSYLTQRIWNYKTWSELYLNHPLSSIIARHVIWHFFNGEKKAQGIFIDDIVDVDNKTIDWLDDTTSVQLWHPIGFEASTVVKWRNFLRNHKILQPFKQAYREVYIVTDAELNTDIYSNRFAANILRQHQFAALCRQRGWRYTLQGSWDSHNTPYKELPSLNMVASFLVDANFSDTNQTGIFNYINTDQVRFTRANEVLPVRDIPAIAFSEVMRDVDLFVGVTSIGNDPEWQDGGANPFMNTYWQNYSTADLSESAKIRSQVLETLIPMLKIASKCSFDKKYLIVKGSVRTYKIHMGSGNILMEPNDSYLCIVPGPSVGSTKEKVFLPFEGDQLLSIIISKALLLADDDKVTDQTILTQIHEKK